MSEAKPNTKTTKPEFAPGQSARLVQVMLHQGVNLFIPRLGVTTSIDLSENGKHKGMVDYLMDTPNKVLVGWTDADGKHQLSGIGHSVIVSYKYELKAK